MQQGRRKGWYAPFYPFVLQLLFVGATTQRCLFVSIYIYIYIYIEFKNHHSILCIHFQTASPLPLFALQTLKKIQIAHWNELPVLSIPVIICWLRSPGWVNGGGTELSIVASCENVSASVSTWSFWSTPTRKPQNLPVVSPAPPEYLCFRLPIRKSSYGPCHRTGIITLSISSYSNNTKASWEYSYGQCQHLDLMWFTTSLYCRNIWQDQHRNFSKRHTELWDT